MAKKQQGNAKEAGSQAAGKCSCGGDLVVARVVGQGMKKICQSCGKIGD